jgi:tetratricopeptide (TPR) repeat protein
MMKRFITYLVCFICVLSTALVFAEIRAFIKEYTYQASELDSKTSCRAIAIEQVKRELLEEMGTYVQSTTVVRDYQIEQDEIRTLSAGVVQTKVLDEKWDGKDYWLKAEVSADPDEVAASIDKLRTDQKLAEELAESQTEKDEALKEVERLKAELANASADKEKLASYNQAINQIQAADSFEQGTALTVAGDYEGAAKAYGRTIDLRPNDAKAYFNRSIVYIYLGNYASATRDLDRAMIIKPANTNVYFQRASAYKDMREKRILPPSQRPSPFARRPSRPYAPKDDPLQRYLNKKQTDQKLVRVNPFRPRPFVQKPAKPGFAEPINQGEALDRSRNSEGYSPSRIDRKISDNQRTRPLQPGRQLQTKERPAQRELSRPDLRKQDRSAPLAIDRRKPLVRQRVEPVKQKTSRETEEKKRNPRQQPAEQNEARPFRR